ncbi:hypothetical protein CPB84DRAFT_1779107 [Gymnopilus junonius]|uniref:Uncharacterized protein n=1 Tax=Gymnopilus junonius TaxID=109634 RepID=A0A9P5TNP4_GYMJU|nr:hypothetical protein CPB84DRAFT_1779107 [Gymnopilus junonius]
MDRLKYGPTIHLHHPMAETSPSNTTQVLPNGTVVYPTIDKVDIHIFDEQCRCAHNITS